MVRLRWFHAGIHVLHGRVCLAHTAITPAVGRPARCTVTVPGDTGSVGDVVPHRHQASSRIWRVATSLPAFYKPRSRSAAPVTSRCTRSVATHPIRRDAPDQKGCNAYGSGAPPPATSPTTGNSSPQTPTVCIGRRHTASTYSSRLRTRSVAPFREHYTS